ncbi:MAG: hypothetical protein K2N23_03750 [Clostridia bacterium]|nr:hypothetical protein [Clostridia bacterium]
MTKFRKSLLIFGILVLIIAAALGTFVVLALTGSLKAEPIALEFTVDPAEKNYDGEPLKADSYKITGGYLVEGHTPIVSFTGEQTDVGNGTSGLDVKIVDKKGYDVSDEYKIKVISGVLRVNTGNVRIILGNRTIPYDGNAIDIGDEIPPAPGLAKGHRVTLQISDRWLESKGKIVAGNILNAETDITPLILDSNGRDVTDFYNYALSGRIRIDQRPLIISPVDASKPYDGTSLQCSQGRIDAYSLASGHWIEYGFSTTDDSPANLTDVGSIKVKATAIIYDINGDDVTANYAFTSNYGTLTVTKAPLTVNLKEIEKQYGDSFNESWDQLCTIDSTISGLRLVFARENYLTNTFGDREIGTAPYTFGVSDIKIYDGMTDITDKFNITVNSSNMKITRREVSIVQDDTNRFNAVYGGDFTFAVENNKIWFDKGLAKGHKIESVTCKSVDAGNAVQAPITSLSVVDEEGKDASAYYKIMNLTAFNVILDVAPKKVLVYLPDDCEVETETGTMNSLGILTYIMCDELSPEDFTVLSETYTRGGVYEVTFDWKEKNTNYDIESGNNKFTLIKNVQETISVDTANKTYDAEPIKAEDLTFEKLGLEVEKAESYSLQSSNLFDKTDAGTYEAKIVYQTGYDRVTVTGAYKIKPMYVTVSGKINTVYNGLPCKPHLSDLSVKGSLGDIEFEVKSFSTATKIINAGKNQTLKFSSVDLIISNTGASVNSNNITVDLNNSAVEVNISERDLSITIDTITCNAGSIASLNGQDLTGLIKFTNLADGDTVRYFEDDVTEYEDGYNVILVTNVWSQLQAQIKVFRGEEDVTANYIIPNSDDVTGLVIITT